MSQSADFAHVENGCGMSGRSVGVARMMRLMWGVISNCMVVVRSVCE